MQVDGATKIANEDVPVVSAEMIESEKCLIGTVALLMPGCTQSDSLMKQGTFSLGSCLLVNRKRPEMTKPTETTKQQPKRLKVLFKKGSRRRSGRSPNTHLSDLNNCSSACGDDRDQSDHIPPGRETNRMEGSLTATHSFAKAPQVESSSSQLTQQGENTSDDQQTSSAFSSI